MEEDDANGHMVTAWPWAPGSIAACAEFSLRSLLERPLSTVELHPLELHTLIGALGAMAVRAIDNGSPVGKIAADALLGRVAELRWACR
jgi:hypothetical protein